MNISTRNKNKMGLPTYSTKISPCIFLIDLFAGLELTNHNGFRQRSRNNTFTTLPSPFVFYFIGFTNFQWNICQNCRGRDLLLDIYNS